MSFTSCQHRRRKVATDRVPISPLPRAELPFQYITLDCIGPIDPPSSKGHKYCLFIVDSCTRWPAVCPLKRLDAREVCDAIIELFMYTGIATFISSDNASNFVNTLTQEFEARLRCSPRFNTQVTQWHLVSVIDETHLWKTRKITRFVNVAKDRWKFWRIRGPASWSCRRILAIPWQRICRSSRRTLK